MGSVWKTLLFTLGAVPVLLLSGCGHRTAARLPAPAAAPPPARIAPTPAPPGGIDADDLDYIATHRPILTQVGLATWYRAPYAGRRSANGQIFSDDALTAANRTLPLGALVVVTNLRTGQSSPMRITDRGPFVEGRILDLTIASARAIGIYRSGSAMVRMDIYRAPKPILTGGRWCVQIGALKNQRQARKLKRQLERRYPGARVIDFPGETEHSYWVRIRPEGDDRGQAEFIARHVHPAEGEAFITRLD
ncbi:MAG: septal ring lytic transglycosylase RlpA family protein [Terracidiphilus sp.]